MDTYHSYAAACPKELYEEYGNIDNVELLMRRIQSIGVHLQEPFRGADGKLYNYMIMVNSDTPLTSELFEYFPKITTRWYHREEPKLEKGARPPVEPYTVQDHKGRLHVKTLNSKITFRI